MLETFILLIVLVVVLYFLVKREEPAQKNEIVKNYPTNTNTSTNPISSQSNRVKIVKKTPTKRFESFNTKYGYVKNSNSPDSIFDFMDWYLLNNLLLTNNDYVDFDKETFLAYPNARSIYLEDSRVYFLDEYNNKIGYYDIGFENEELIVNTDQGTYYIDLDAAETLTNFRVELAETNDVVVYNNSTEEFNELDNSQKPYYMQEHTINEDEIVDAEFENETIDNETIDNKESSEPINPALASGMVEYEMNSSNHEEKEFSVNEDRYSSESVNSSTNY